MRFMKAMHSIAKVTGKDVATAFDLSSFTTACDVGGNHNLYYLSLILLKFKKIWTDLFAAATGCTGAMAYEFTKAHPGLSVIVFDLPPVIEMRSYFQPKELDDRVSFVAGEWS